jgi:lipoprotein-anchoring transpeptidase ErfK/SrfK
VEVDLNARKLYLYENGTRVETHAVAIGSAKWPTQPGEWTIKQVIFNPEWIPPDETWAEERQPKKSGAADNPLGRAQLVYDPPRTIHGTNQPSSIGTNTSHGSIRMNNSEIVALAKRIMTASGAPKDAAWYTRAATQRSEKQVVDLPTPVPIKVF